MGAAGAWLTVTLCGLVVEASPAAEAALPAALVGTWDVERVAVDSGDQPHWKFRPDDPQLLGRELVIDGERARFNGAKEPNCDRPGWKRRPSTWGRLVAAGLLRGGGESDPSPADYGLEVSRKAAVTAYSFCNGAGDPRQREPAGAAWAQGSWLVPQTPTRLVMHLDDQTLLILVRRKADAKPQASFPCARAASPTEKAICASFALAAWDRSVALGWRHATENGTTDELLAEQKAWLRTRDACAADAACLEETMRKRTTSLMLR
jgi:hypothetical protein